MLTGRHRFGIRCGALHDRRHQVMLLGMEQLDPSSLHEFRTRPSESFSPRLTIARKEVRSANRESIHCNRILHEKIKVPMNRVHGDCRFSRLDRLSSRVILFRNSKKSCEMPDVEFLGHSSHIIRYFGSCSRKPIRDGLLGNPSTSREFCDRESAFMKESFKLPFKH